MIARLSLVRRRWDSNPRALSSKRISSAPRYDRFDTSPQNSRHSHPPEIGEMYRRDMRDFINPCFAEIPRISRVCCWLPSTMELRFRVLHLRPLGQLSIWRCHIDSTWYYSTPAAHLQGAILHFFGSAETRKEQEKYTSSIDIPPFRVLQFFTYPTDGFNTL